MQFKNNIYMIERGTDHEEMGHDFLDQLFHKFAKL